MYYLIIYLFISGDIGGYLGLLVGASILSVCEIIDVCLHIGVQHYNKRKKIKDTEQLSPKSDINTDINSVETFEKFDLGQ